jgi:hypothetical protein
MGDFFVGLGALFFGITIGWMTYRIMRFRVGIPGLSDIVAIVAAIGGAAVLALFRSDVLFGLYSIGLVIGFFGYFGVGVRLFGVQELQPWRLEQIPPPPPSPPATQPEAQKD